MPETIIAVENLSKRYLIGHRAAERDRYVALRDVISREVRTFVRKAGEFFHGRQIVQGDRIEEFWALKDVSFQVKQGDVIGIIGRNGAGKSTLLKILSRITAPTEGRARLKGRVASLLEVGTGFHPELTGRENIYLNGAILGMSRAEIRRKFDEIVAFAEIEEFLDTPVKRYSSGMYVRLAFAVAAHLEPEILVIDEVLAVGDINFQKKCLGKMEEVASGGRTILFVSHNLAAVRTLTAESLLLENGRVAFFGPTGRAIDLYTKNLTDKPAALRAAKVARGRHTVIREAHLLDTDGQVTQTYAAGQPLQLRLVFETDGAPSLSLDAFLLDQSGVRIASYSEYRFYGRTLPRTAGTYECRLELDPLWLVAGTYYLDLMVSVTNGSLDHYVPKAMMFDVPYCNPGGSMWDLNQTRGVGFLALTARGEVVCRSLDAVPVESSPA